MASAMARFRLLDGVPEVPTASSMSQSRIRSTASVVGPRGLGAAFESFRTKPNINQLIIISLSVPRRHCRRMTSEAGTDLIRRETMAPGWIRMAPGWAVAGERGEDPISSCVSDLHPGEAVLVSSGSSVFSKIDRSSPVVSPDAPDGTPPKVSEFPEAGFQFTSLTSLVSTFRRA